MEIKKLLTSGTMSLYFGEPYSITEEAHEDTYLAACVYSINVIETLFSDNIVLQLKYEIDCSDLDEMNEQKRQKRYVEYCFSKNFLFMNKEKILKSIYHSKNNEVLIISEKLMLNVYSDPIDIRMYYGNQKKEQEKLSLTTKGLWKIFGN